MHTRKWPLLGALIMALAVAVGVYATGPPDEGGASSATQKVNAADDDASGETDNTATICNPSEVAASASGASTTAYPPTS